MELRLLIWGCCLGCVNNMKIDSEYLDIDINPEFSNQSGRLKISHADVTLWDDGDIELEKGDYDLFINLNELAEIVRVAKMFRDRRDAYLSSIK